MSFNSAARRRKSWGGEELLQRRTGTDRNPGDICGEECVW